MAFEDIQLKIAQEGFSKDLFNLDIRAHSEVLKESNSQESFYREKSRIK